MDRQRIITIALVITLLVIAVGGAALGYFWWSGKLCPKPQDCYLMPLVPPRNGPCPPCPPATGCDSSNASARKPFPVPTEAWKRCDAEPNRQAKILCQQKACLAAGGCWAPFYMEGSKVGPPWCFKPADSQ